MTTLSTDYSVMKPLRVCRVCGLKVFTIEKLDKFNKDKRCPYGHANICKKCVNKYNYKWKRDHDYKEVHTQRRLKLIAGFPKPIRCYFCGEKITKLEGKNAESLAIHSLDGNHENFDPDNKVPTHNSCHTSGRISPRLGIKHTDETKMKISKSLTGKKLSAEHRRNIGKSHRGEKHWNWKGENAKEESKRQRGRKYKRKRDRYPIKN